VYKGNELLTAHCSLLTVCEGEKAMRKIWFILGIIALALIGCNLGCSAAGGNEPAAPVEDTAANNAPITKTEAAGEEPALVTVEVTEENLLTVEANESEASEDVVVSTVAPAGSVDLSQLTPEPPAEGGDLIVQPMPGVPDPLVAIVNQASQDLAQRLGRDVSEVTLVRTVAVDWRDGSLGCPQPGMAYTMAIVSGYQIVLEVQDTDYYYHTRGTDYFIYCENGRPVEESGAALPGADQ
jgi:hypothetical protein